MKPNLKYIGLVLTVALAWGCSKSDPGYTQRTIELMAQSPDEDPATSKVSSRGEGSITKWNNTPVKLLHGLASMVYEEPWDATINPYGNVNIAGSPPYPPDDKPVFIRAYYPARTLETDDKTVIYTGLDGTDDLMLSAETSASNNSPFKPESWLSFTHLFTQLAFEVVTHPDEPFPPSITIKEIRVYPTAGHPFCTAASVNTTLPTASAMTLTYDDSIESFTAFNGAASVSTKATVIGGTLLPPSPGGSYSVKASVLLSDGTFVDNLEPITAAFVQNRAYKVTLTFKGLKITAKVPTVTNWITVTYTKPEGDTFYFE